MKPRSHRSREVRRGRRRWYLLIHQLPPKPLYLRAKIRRRLIGVGAIALKKSVYVLPQRDQCLEDFERIAEEACAGGGEAYVCAAEFPKASTDDALLGRFAKERNADYESIAESLRSTGNRPAQLARARKRLEEIARVDFFDAPSRLGVEKQLRRVEAAARRRSRSPADPVRASLRRRTWVTRRGVHIDRIASAWLIRRFIDPDARYRFIDPTEERRPGELRFDMVGGDFTHDGDACTFETLVRIIRNPDPGLRNVAEIVHDIDLKDGKFARPDAAGVQQIVLGIVLECPDDEGRLNRGFVLFDVLYASFRRRHPLAKEVSR